jgi:hypothetical protein
MKKWSILYVLCLVCITTGEAFENNSITPVPGNETADDAIWIHSISVIIAVSVIPIAVCIYFSRIIFHATIIHFPSRNANEIENAVVIAVETVPDTEPSLPGLQADYLGEGYQTPRVVRSTAVEPTFQMS